METWEERFEKRIKPYVAGQVDTDIEEHSMSKIKTFIKQERSNLILEIKREVEGMKDPEPIKVVPMKTTTIDDTTTSETYFDRRGVWFNEALSQIIKYLNEKEGGKND